MVPMRPNGMAVRRTGSFFEVRFENDERMTEIRLSGKRLRAWAFRLIELTEDPEFKSGDER